MTPAGSPSGLRVALLHNYRDEQQPSMRLYAERLGEALVRRGGVTCCGSGRPASCRRRGARRSTVWTKIDALRRAGSPSIRGWCATSTRTSSTSSTTGRGICSPSWTARRTIVTCHDVILLALAAGRIGAARVPPVALQLFRISLEFDEARRGRRRGFDPDEARPGQHSSASIPTRSSSFIPGLNQAFAPRSRATGRPSTAARPRSTRR